jgi:hypothetical protein
MASKNTDKKKVAAPVEGAVSASEKPQEPEKILGQIVLAPDELATVIIEAGIKAIAELTLDELKKLRPDLLAEIDKEAIAELTIEQIEELRPDLLTSPDDNVLPDCVTDKILVMRPGWREALEADLRNKILAEAEEALKEAPAAAPSLGNDRYGQAIKELGAEGNVLNICDTSDGRVCIVTNDGRKLYWPVG